MVGVADTKKGQVRPFADFLAEHNNGQAAREASDLLHDLIAAVEDTGKKGTLTITVSLSQMDEGTLVALVKTAMKAPVHEPKSGIYYVTGDGNLTRNDPQALPFESLKEVAAPALAVHSSDADDRRDDRAAAGGLA